MAKMISISAKKLFKNALWLLLLFGLYIGFVYAKRAYQNPDFGKEFGNKAAMAEQRLQKMDSTFALCAKLCHKSPAFLKSIVFPEVMRYNTLKDGIEAESLRTLYVELGTSYADFSIGLFQMKPSFALQVETKAKQLLSDSIYKELTLDYELTDAQEIRSQRVDRMMDAEWQQVYLTAFVLLCDTIYAQHTFSSSMGRLQWYATVYNAGFDRADIYIAEKVKKENFYLGQGMPGKKFSYAAIAGWFFTIAGTNG